MNPGTTAAQCRAARRRALFGACPFDPFGALTLALALMVASAALAQPAGRAGETITTNDPAFRGLMIKTHEPGRYVPAPLLATEVSIEVTGPVARTRVRQHYFNPTKGWIEGVYVFPLSDKSAVDVLRMRIGDRIVEGVIKERVEARRVYERARANGRRAALLESHRPNVFMANIANIGPSQSITIEIAYQKTVPVRDGEFRLRFPMVVGPRYFPKGASGILLAGGKAAHGTVDGTARDIKHVTSPVLPPGDGKINPLTLVVRINGVADPTAVMSHHHRVTKSSAEDGSLQVKLATGPVPADRDFELTWPASRKASTAVLFTEEWQGHHYGLVMVAPPRDAVPHVIAQGREIIFVMDTSGSMAGRSIIQAKSSLIYALAGLKPADRFNVIQFNSHTDALFDRVVPATPRNRLMARAYVKSLKAEGGTEMRSALFAALSGAVNPSRLRQVVFITDGAVGNERQLFGTIARRLGDARLFTVGIGSAPNRYFMRAAARRGRGTFTFIGSPEQVEPRMKMLWQKLSKPVITHLAVAPVTESAMELWPDPVPDLFAGAPVYVAVRFLGAPTDIAVSGKSAAGSWQRRLSFSSAPKGKGIAKLWAREKIASLQSLRYEGVAPDEIRRQTIAVALAHGLVTRHTSLVAVDKIQARDTDVPLRREKLPHNLPHGWVYDKVFGKGAGDTRSVPRKALMDRARQQFQLAGVTMKSSPATAAAKPGQGSGNSTTLQLPQTATHQTVYLIIGVLSLMAALFLLWLGRMRRKHG